MAAAPLMSAAATKIALTWFTGQLTQWIKDKKADETETKLWAEVCKKNIGQTKATASRYEKITTVAFPRTSVNLEQIYVPLTLRHSDSDQSVVVDKFPKGLITEKQKLLIVDAAGMGKSTISRILFLSSLSERHFLPILIDIRRLDGVRGIEECLMKQFGLRDKHKDLLQVFLTTQPLLYLLDGFDEVASSKKLEVARTIRHFVDRSERGTFVMTSRPDLPFGEYSDFLQLRVRELSKDESLLLIKKYGAAYGIPERAKALTDELQNRHDGPVESFLKNPLLTSLLFRAFEFKSVIPVKRGVFYRQVFDALYEAHDLSKETGYVREKKTGLHHDEFHRSVRALARLFKKKQVIEVERDTFIEFARRISKELCPDLIFSPEDLLHDVLHAVPLFLQDGNLVRWAHKSLLDYFLCEFLLRDYSGAKSEALRKASSGVKARVNENFLMLVHEADPTLFAQSITLPAVQRLLKRSADIAQRIPKSISPNVAADMCTIFSSYEIVISPSDNADVEFWIESDKRSPVDPDRYVPLLMYSFGPGQGSLGVYAFEAAVALHVPMMTGSIAFEKGHSITRGYDRISSFPEIPKATTTFLSSRTTPQDWETAEDDFATLMGFLWSADFKLITQTVLEAAKRDLEKLTTTSLDARSDDVF